MADVRVRERGSVDAKLAARLAALDRLAFPPRLQYPEAEYVARGSQPGAWVALAEEGADVVAFCLAAPDAEDASRLFLDVLAVRPDRRRRGIAGALVRRCFAHAREAGFSQVSVTCEPVTDEGVDLVAFYAALGFEVAQRREDHVLMVASPRA